MESPGISRLPEPALDRASWATSRRSRVGSSSLNSELPHEYTQFHARSLGIHPDQIGRISGRTRGHLAGKGFLEEDVIPSGCSNSPVAYL